MGAEMNQSVYSALVNGRTVCTGYARPFNTFCSSLASVLLLCRIAGKAMHGISSCWMVNFYNVDTTWDDTGDGTYDYFNKTDEDYAGTISGRNFPYTCLPAMDSHTGIWAGSGG